MKNIKKILQLYNISYLDKYDKYIMMFNNDNSLSIRNIIPDYLISEYDYDFELSNKELLNIDSDLYHLVYDNILTINDSLFEAALDMPLYSIIIEQEKNENILNNIKKFKGYAFKSNKMKYNFSSTITGRLTISDNENYGNILTLPKRCRKIFKSNWNYEGELLLVDFKSLEPRIIKKMTSNENYEDIYETIKDNSGINVDRSIIKKAVISLLYGSELNVDYLSKEKCEEIMNYCNHFFNIKKVEQIANNNICEYNGLFRKNYFGRPIYNINETKTNIILNNYIQSTAVDVSLMYFYELINNINKELCKPLFIIHDAIVFDVHNSYKDEFTNIIKKGYICPKLGYFPLEITSFTNNKE